MLSNKKILKCGKKKGLSLLEILVSLGLVALFIIPAGNMVLGTVKLNKAAEEKQQAIAVLQEAVELIKMEEQDLPETKNEYININNQFRVTRLNEDSELGKFKVESLNESEYGFNIIGTISEVERIITESNINIDEAVDGAMYFSGNDEGAITVVDRQMSTTDCVEDIISSGDILFNKVEGNKISIASNNGDKNSGISLYTIQLKAIKNNKEYESIGLDFIK